MTRNDNQDLSRSNPKSRLKATSSDFAPQSQGDIATGHSTQPVRVQYENAYRHLRARDYGNPGGIWDLIDKRTKLCALESLMVGRHYWFTGWTDLVRRAEFVNRLGEDPLMRIPF